MDHSHSGRCHEPRFESVVKRRCHSCKCDIAEAFSVPCRADHCHKFFCQKCLTSRYKYSKAKAASLPSINWKCPVCTRRCFCLECINTGLVVRKRKAIYKRDMYTTRRRTKKRPRPRPKRKAQIEPNYDKAAETSKAYNAYGERRKISGTTGGSHTSCFGAGDAARSPANENEPQPLFTFSKALAAKSTEPEYETRTNVALRLQIRLPMYSEETYANMTLIDSLKIAFMPFNASPLN